MANAVLSRRRHCLRLEIGLYGLEQIALSVASVTKVYTCDDLHRPSPALRPERETKLAPAS
ncbi:MAG: hypothetical protein ACR5LG_13085 [Sodalis sp. (in: enterobacteria)]|uniref:hypothetical protein n=1 Tax=Sodalis sp. (in: enterobacteria) TaxID=1898979 RepID=UPI003F2C915F